MVKRFIRSARATARSELRAAAAATLLLISVPGVSVAEKAATGRELIENMSVAMQDLTYSGTFIYAHDGDVETMQIDHSKVDGIEYEKLFSLNGEAREIVRTAENVVCVWPGTKAVAVYKANPRTPFPEFDAEQLAVLAKWYQFERVGKDRVADRKANIVDIMPTDNYRYGYRLWVDAETSLILRSVMSDNDGRIIEQVMFTNIEYLDSIPLDQFQVSSSGDRMEWSLGADKPLYVTQPETDIPSIDGVTVPGGFDVVSDGVIELPSQSVVRRITYADGLASLSVYVAPTSGTDSFLEGMGGMGAVHAYGVMKDKWHVTVVGEVPEVTVEMLGKTLKLTGL